ncbi:uncharacterized protein LOC143295080 [Babylonia areolata]|uniref:uncharacterized protein LOC143295080 n=1 Tax=Babylonia areolata TaxID=304850 RepID=UPI003FD23BBF
MSIPRDSVSRACLRAGNKNAHCQSALKHELELLDKEKEHLLHSIRHEAKQFRQQFSNYSASPGSRPGSSTHSRVGSASPGRAHPDRVSSACGSPSRDSCRTPRSPRASPLLPRRQSSAGGNRSPESQHKSPVIQSQHVFVTEIGSDKLLLVNVADMKKAASPRGKASEQASGDQSTLPQIVVSDDAPGTKSQGRQRKGITSHAPPSRSGSDSGSDVGSPLSQSLNLPAHRPRSSSMSSVTALQPSSSRPLSRRQSTLHETSHSPDLHVPDSGRGRSASFSGIKPARRRGSITEQWGSISERKRPEMGSLKGRRGSVDMENLLRDLSFGVQHSELLSPVEQGPPVSDQLWEQLKKCRYLRVPSRDGSEGEDGQD